MSSGMLRTLRSKGPHLQSVGSDVKGCACCCRDAAHAPAQDAVHAPAQETTTQRRCLASDAWAGRCPGLAARRWRGDGVHSQRCAARAVQWRPGTHGWESAPRGGLRRMDTSPEVCGGGAEAERAERGGIAAWARFASCCSTSMAGCTRTHCRRAHTSDVSTVHLIIVCIRLPADPRACCRRAGRCARRLPLPDARVCSMFTWHAVQQKGTCCRQSAPNVCQHAEVLRAAAEHAGVL